MKRAWWILCLVAVAGCGGAQHGRSTPEIDSYREAAHDDPNDAEAWTRLYAAELFVGGGRAENIPEVAARAQHLAPNSSRVLLLTAIDHDVHGRLNDAFAAYLHAVAVAAPSNAEGDQAIAAMALGSAEDLVDYVPRGPARAVEVLTPLLSHSGTMSASVSFEIANMLMDAAYRRGQIDEARRLATGAGCVTSWRVAGPFGPRDLLGFDQTLPAEARGALAESYDLGASRGVRPTRSIESRGCITNLGGGPVAAGGATIAEGHFHADRDGRYTLRLETPNAVQLFVDGQRVASLDARTTPTARTTHHSVTLSAGDHEFKVKIVSRHPNPVMVLSVASTTYDEDTETMHSGVPEFDAYGESVVALARGNTVAARELMRLLADNADATGAVLVVRAAIALGDPLVPADVRRDDARRFARAALQRDPGMWQPALQLARLLAADGQVTEAIAQMRTIHDRWPENIAISMSLSEMLLDKDWDAEADQVVEDAHRRVPDSCMPLRGLYDAAHRRNRFSVARTLADQIVACDARSYTKLGVLLDAREWDAARAELDRVSAFEPRHSHATALASRVDLARGRNDEALLRESLQALLLERPLAGDIPVQLADIALAQGRTEEALQILNDAIAREPSAMVDLRDLRHTLGGIDDITPLRRNGTQILADFIASGRTYREPQVLVFDYAATRVFEDGSTIELVHQIYKVQSEESVDDLGEFSLPEGARILTLRTIKADGRRMEPDQIAGKDTISLPSVAIGDFVEHEYIVLSGPSAGFPGGFLGNRFFFRNFEEPFDFSQQVVVLPRNMIPVIDPRGPAPAVEERVDGDVRILTFTVHESRPLQPEPSTIAPREFLPSVNVGVNATWNSFQEGMRDQLADRAVVDPAAQRQLQVILGGEDADDLEPIQKAQRIYAWVLENIEASEDFFGSAPIMLAARTGHRARVLHYLLKLAGVPAELVAVRSAGGDTTRSELADGETYGTALVRLALPEGVVWLSPADRGAPFGFVPRLLRGQEGMVLDPGGDRVTVRDSIAGEDTLRVDVDVRLGNESTARIDVVETLRGAGAIAWRGQLENIPAAELERRFEEGYVARLVPGAVLAALEIRGRENAEEPLELRYSFDVRGFGRHVGGRWILAPLFPTQLQAAFASRAARTLPELVGTPIERVLTIRYHADNQALPTALPDVNLQGPNGASVRVTSEIAGNTYTLTRAVTLPLMRIQPAAYAAFATFCRAADEAETRELAFTDR